VAQERGLSYTLRVVLGLAAAGLTLFFMNMAAEFIVQILLAWIIVLSASSILLAAEEGRTWLDSYDRDIDRYLCFVRYLGNRHHRGWQSIGRASS